MVKIYGNKRSEFMLQSDKIFNCFPPLKVLVIVCLYNWDCWKLTAVFTKLCFHYSSICIKRISCLIVLRNSFVENIFLSWKKFSDNDSEFFSWINFAAFFKRDNKIFAVFWILTATLEKNSCEEKSFKNTIKPLLIIIIKKLNIIKFKLKCGAAHTLFHT